MLARQNGGGLLDGLYPSPLTRWEFRRCRKARITHVGVNEPVIEGPQGRVADAIGWLRKAQTGDVKGVLDHPDVAGPIDVIHRSPEGGLLRIDDDHPGGRRIDRRSCGTNRRL